VVDYPTREIYSYGGRTPVRKAYGEAAFDLNETASNGYKYFSDAKGGSEAPNHDDKDYHEQVNDYPKNISDAIFSPGLTMP
jgi:hypothetical protein